MLLLEGLLAVPLAALIGTTATCASSHPASALAPVCPSHPPLPAQTGTREKGEEEFTRVSAIPMPKLDIIKGWLDDVADLVSGLDSPQA